MTPTATQIRIMCHALGIEYAKSGAQPYRNHYCCGPGHDSWEDCMALVERELMSRRNPTELSGGDYVFHVTADGRRVALDNRPPAPKVSRGRRRYMAFRNADSGLSFIEWLKCYGHLVP
ncbi:MAG: hypothetical protein PWQ61_3521 [Betaproteobacteria bacterium]|nr:hypothetical protein [Betaproteobacteria bacterium]